MQQPILTEDVLLDNLPEGWTYDVQYNVLAEVWCFVIFNIEGESSYEFLSIPV